MAAVAVVAVVLLSCPSGSCSSEVPAVAVLVAVEVADRNAALVCMAGLSARVASENVTLRSLMGCSAALCIPDSLKTTSALRMTCLVSGVPKPVSEASVRSVAEEDTLP